MALGVRIPLPGTSRDTLLEARDVLLEPPLSGISGLSEVIESDPADQVLDNFTDCLERLLAYIVAQSITGNELMIVAQNLQCSRRLHGIWWLPHRGLFRLGRSVANRTLGPLLDREQLVTELRRQAIGAAQQLGLCKANSKGYRPRFQPPHYASPFSSRHND